ncbi:MAG: hypothetical protein ACXW6T_15400 [Candidatus Binatia bacterium]
MQPHVKATQQSHIDGEQHKNQSKDKARLALWANFSMRKSQEGGFHTRPDTFLRPLRSLRPFFFSVAALPRQQRETRR